MVILWKSHFRHIFTYIYIWYSEPLQQRNVLHTWYFTYHWWLHGQRHNHSIQYGIFVIPLVWFPRRIYVHHADATNHFM
jgi:hypothetical protein